MGGLNEKEHRDFWVFRDRSKNVIFGFFGVEKFIKIFISSSRIFQNFRNKNQKEKINFIELLINIDSFETKFFILSTIKNTGQVFRVIWPHLQRFRQIWRNGHVGPYKVRALESWTRFQQILP